MKDCTPDDASALLILGSTGEVGSDYSVSLETLKFSPTVSLHMPASPNFRCAFNTLMEKIIPPLIVRKRTCIERQTLQKSSVLCNGHKIYFIFVDTYWGARFYEAKRWLKLLHIGCDFVELCSNEPWRPSCVGVFVGIIRCECDKPIEHGCTERYCALNESSNVIFGSVHPAPSQMIELYISPCAPPNNSAEVVHFCGEGENPQKIWKETGYVDKKVAETCGL